MGRVPWGWGILLGALTSVPVIVLTYLGNVLAMLPLVPFDLFDLLGRILPGPVVTWAIHQMVSIINRLKLGSIATVAKQAEHALALVQFVVIGAIFGLVVILVGWRDAEQRLPGVGLVAGIVLLVLVLIAEFVLGMPGQSVVGKILWLALVFIGWGWVLGLLLRSSLTGAAAAGATDASRRRFLYLAGTVVVAAAAAAIGLIVASRRRAALGQETPPEQLSPGQTSGPAASPPLQALEARIQPAPGTRSEVTGNSNFYRVDIDSFPPRVDVASWKLELNGIVDHPLSLTLDDIRARPAVSQYITLECISNPVGGNLISTAMITGVRLKDLLDEAGMQAGAVQVFVRSTDGYYESVALSDAQDERTLLVYEMNGQPLPAAHGYPLRIYIPNRFGMKQPKWIQSMEVMGESRNGYWEDRGWSNAAIPATTAVIDNVAVTQPDPNTQAIPIGGIAYAGARGISKVEVQLDNGPWTASELRAPALSPLTWVQWRYDWPPQSGRHTARVRAYDGTGQLQPTQARPPEPDGATGVNATSFSVY